MDILRADTYKPAHSYNSSDSSSYDRVTSLPRSESGTSHTHYDDMSRELSPKDHINGFSRDSYDMGRPQIPPMPTTQAHAPKTGADPMDLHILVESAISDSKSFETVSPERLDKLKKDEASLSRKIETVKRNLTLETKVRTAAQSMNRLGGKGSRSSTDNKELMDSTRKCEEMAQELLKLERQLFETRQQRLEHTAAVLQQHASKGADGQKSGWRDSNDWGHGFGFGAGALANTKDGIMDLDLDGDGPSPAVKTKLRALNDTVSRLVVSTGQDAPQLNGNATADQEMDLLQAGLSRIEKWHNETSRLWDVIGSNEEDMRQRRLQRSLEDDNDSEADESDDDERFNEQFSMQAFSVKVHRLCERAASLQGKQYALRSQLSQATQQVEASRGSEEAQAQLQQLQQEMERERASHKERSKTLGSEKEHLESEIARLTTEVTMARAELEAAHGSRAERAAEASKSEVELNAKNEQLSQELSELVAEHEALVRQGVEAERDREALEGNIDNLRDKVEQLEVKLQEEKVRLMAAPDGNAEAAREATSMSVMRVEFKKMMREARAEHFRNLRMEQEERRRLEALIRTMRKDQGQPSPSTLSPQPMAKSKLGRTVTAS